MYSHLKGSRAVQHCFLKIPLMWLKNDKCPLMLVTNREFYSSTLFSLEKALTYYDIFQVGIKSVQTDSITFPFNVYVSEIEFDAEDVATITSKSKSETISWHINCWPEEVC